MATLKQIADALNEEIGAWDGQVPEQVSVPGDFLLDVYALVKPEAPRVLSLAELRALPLGAVVWEEYRQDDGACGHVCPTLVCEGKTLTNSYMQNIRMDRHLLGHDEAGFQARYWSGEPTRGQRGARPWA